MQEKNADCWEKATKKRRGDAFFGLGRDVIRADLRHHRR